MFRKLPGAGDGIQTCTGVVVRACKTFIKMWPMETDSAKQEGQQSAEDGRIAPVLPDLRYGDRLNRIPNSAALEVT